MHTRNTNLPIGVFDSGLGGLTVVKALMERLPNESIAYFGDTARVPYGVRSAKTIRRYAGQIVSFLLAKRVKALVIACNSISAVAGDDVLARAEGLPVFDVITAGAEAAGRSTKNGKVGVIATTATVNSGAYANKIRQLDPGIDVVSKACPLLVPLVEEGWIDGEITRLVVEKYLAEVLDAGVDTLVMGCTHYPLLHDVLGSVAKDCVLVDSAITTAERAAIGLGKLDLLNDGSDQGPHHRFYVSDLPKRFKAIGESFLGRPFEHLEQVALEPD